MCGASAAPAFGPLPAPEPAPAQQPAPAPRAAALLENADSRYRTNACSIAAFVASLNSSMMPSSRVHDQRAYRFNVAERAATTARRAASRMQGLASAAGADSLHRQRCTRRKCRVPRGQRTTCAAQNQNAVRRTDPLRYCASALQLEPTDINSRPPSAARSHTARAAKHTQSSTCSQAHLSKHTQPCTHAEIFHGTPLDSRSGAGKSHHILHHAPKRVPVVSGATTTRHQPIPTPHTTPTPKLTHISDANDVRWPACTSGAA